MGSLLHSECYGESCEDKKEAQMMIEYDYLSCCIVVISCCSWMHVHCADKGCSERALCVLYRRFAHSFVRSLMGRVVLPLMFSSSGSVYNVYAEEEEDGDSSAAAQQSLENSITMNKMKLLKAKMEDMNLNKKVGS